MCNLCNLCNLKMDVFSKKVDKTYTKIIFPLKCSFMTENILITRAQKTTILPQ